MGQIPTLGTPFRRKKTTIKRGVKINKGGDPEHTRRSTRKSSSDLAENPFSLLNSAHGEYLDGRYSHTKTQLFDPLSTNLLYWAHWSKTPYILGLAWKDRVPTIGAVCGKSLCVSKCNDQSQWGQAPATRSPLERLLWRWYWARVPAHRKIPPRPWKNPPQMDIVEGKRDNRPPVARLQIIPQGRKSTKAEKDNGENGSV